MTKILVFPRGRQRAVYGSGKSERIYLMGGNLFHYPKDWLYAGDSACLWVRQHERDTGGIDGGAHQR